MARLWTVAQMHNLRINYIAQMFIEIHCISYMCYSTHKCVCVCVCVRNAQYMYMYMYMYMSILIKAHLPYHHNGSFTKHSFWQNE